MGRTARRLAGAATLALLLTAAAAAAVPASGTEGWGQAGAPASPFGWAPASLPGGGAVGGRGGPVLGVVGYRPAVLAWLDPRTLRPLPGRRIELTYGISGYGWSPDRSLLVLGDVDDDVLHLLDPARMRRLGTIRFGIVARAPQSLAWLGPRRLAVVAGDPSDGSHLLMVDPVARKVLWRRQLEPAMLSVAAAGDRLVVLSTPIDRIAAVRLLVVDGRGRIRTVELSGTQAGYRSPPDWDRPGAYAVSRDAALAVDPRGGRAFLVAAGATVAEVDLASLRVSHHGLRHPTSLLRRLAHWLVPPAQAKQLSVGSWRDACWLGGGSLAVWGIDTRMVGQVPAEQLVVARASGLKLVDTRSWTLRPLDPAATLARWQAGRLLAFGSIWDPGREEERGIGLNVHAPGERRPRHLLGTQAVQDAYLNGDLVYASVDSGREQWGYKVVSLASGRTLASSRAPLPFLVLGERDRPC